MAVEKYQTPIVYGCEPDAEVCVWPNSTSGTDEVHINASTNGYKYAYVFIKNVSDFDGKDPALEWFHNLGVDNGTLIYCAHRRCSTEYPQNPIVVLLEPTGKHNNIIIIVIVIL